MILTKQIDNPVDVIGFAIRDKFTYWFVSLIFISITIYLDGEHEVETSKGLVRKDGFAMQVIFIYPVWLEWRGLLILFM